MKNEQKYETNKNLTRWIVILPLLSIIITVTVLVNIFLRYEKEVFQENLRQIRASVVKKSKLNAQDEVLEAINYIETSKNILKEEAKKEAQNMINFAIGGIDSAYRTKPELSKKVLLKRATERMRHIRFFENKSGYFFMYDMTGKCLLLPIAPSLESRNLYDIQDKKGTFIIRESIEMVKDFGEGFYDWYWYKPDAQVMKKKIGYIKGYKELGIFVGTARYEEDILESIKKEIKAILNKIRFEEEGYIFAYDYKGNVISHINPDLVGTNEWDLVVDDEHVTQNIIKGARGSFDGAYITFPVSINPITGQKDRETAFVKDVPELGWVIGKGAFYKDVLNEIALKEISFKEKLSAVLDDIKYVTIGFLLVMFVVTLLISFKLKRVLKEYHTSLITKHKQTTLQKQQLVHQLEHDDLTKLPNRIMMMDRLEQGILLSKRDKTEIAVIFIDIDNFKKINDSMGHDVGDIVLKESAKRLKDSIRESDIVARFGGDEFVILIDNFKNEYDIINIIKKIQDAVKTPIVLRSNEYKLTLSIGICVFPADGIDSHSLLKHADIALYQAKKAGRDTYRFFTKLMNEKIQNRIEIENSLQVACEKGEFILHYQPLVDANSHKILGVEALIRWQHPKLGLIYPDKFIAIAEDSDLIIDIGYWVIDESLNQMVQWKSKGYEIQRVSINIAIRQLEHDGLIKYIKNSLKRSGCKPEWVEVEVIERYVMKDAVKSIKVLNRLREMGISVAIDDFGTGYSSLSYLKNLPITKLKIDRAFIKNLENSFEDRAIVKTIIALGDGLHIQILAEGVETKEQKIFLKDEGCHVIQGYLFSKPVPHEQLDEYLKKGYFENDHSNYNLVNYTNNQKLTQKQNS